MANAGRRDGEHVSVAESERLMLEFLGGGQHFGLLPLSTVVLPSDFGDASQGAGRKSFVYQELTCVRENPSGAAPHWPLILPEEIGRYIAFLEGEVVSYAAIQPVKAIKRAFSLARTIGLYEVAEEALAILKSDDAATYVAYKRLEDTCERLSRCGSIERAVLSDTYDLPLATPTPETITGVTRMLERCHDLVARLAQDVSELESGLPLTI